MKALEDIKGKLKENKDYLKGEYNLNEIGVFGSYVHGTQTSSSDVDILVDFSEPIGLIKFIKLEEELEEILEMEVDLVPKKGIKLELKETILKEAVTV